MVTALAFLLAIAAAIIPVEAVSVCHQDYCLRQIKGSSAQARPYCTSYLGTAYPKIYPVATTRTVTATRTLFVVHSPDPSKPPDYITRKAAPYIAPNKRDEIPGSPVAEQVVEPRQAVLPAFASSCTGAPDRLSSACTCLIGYTVERSTSTHTTTQTSYTVTSHVCTATALGQLRPSYQGDWIDRYAVFSNFGFPTTDIQECCDICYHTWNCVGYYMREDPPTYECVIKRLESSSRPEPRDQSCANGLLEMYDPLPGNGEVFGGPFELGLCSFLTYSDE